MTTINTTPHSLSEDVGLALGNQAGELGELAFAFEKHRPCHIASIAGDWTRDHGRSARLQMDLACSRWVLVGV